MIPKRLDELIHDVLPEPVVRNRCVEEDGLVFMEFTSQDVELLHRLGIEVDSLGPHLVVLMWDCRSQREVGGYLVVDNIAMGKPSMGGIRMSPQITPAQVFDLARGMTLKNAAADLPYGGGKSGIVAGTDLPPSEHREVIRGFAHLLGRYELLYNPGPDVGTNDQDMKTIAIENGLDVVVSKPAEMGGNRIDQLGAAGRGVVIALEALYHDADRLRVLPQFRSLNIPTWDRVTVIVQGCGAVGANVIKSISTMNPAARVVGVSDVSGYIYCEDGLDTDVLLALHESNPLVAKPYFLALPGQLNNGGAKLKYSTDPDDLLRESAFCLIPAAPQANYLDLDPSSQPSMTIDKAGRWVIIAEGANTYSPEPARKAARRRMEREMYQKRGTLIATDFLVNSGGVIFAAHERLIQTPSELQIPPQMLGNRSAVDDWLATHAEAFAQLAEKRRVAAEQKRDTVIRENMKLLIDGLISNEDAIPCQVAEEISIGRIVRSESDRAVSDIMTEMVTVLDDCEVEEAARTLVEKNTDILAVTSRDGQVVGIMTDWDITRAVACGQIRNVKVNEVMSRDIISCLPQDGIVEAVAKLEHYGISALPVISPNGLLMGAVSSNILATRTLYRLLLVNRERSPTGVR